MAGCRHGVFIFKNLLLKHNFINHTDTRNMKRWVAPTLKTLKGMQRHFGPQPESPRSSYLEWNRNAELYAFGKRLREEFNRPLLEQALTNRSYIIQEEIKRENSPELQSDIKPEDNLSLIKEGEELMKEYVGMYLTEALPKFPKEGVQEVCERLTSIEWLANVAQHIGLRDITLCADFPVEPQTLSDTLKAVIAALYRSSDRERTNKFIEEFIILRQITGHDINTMWQIDEPLKMLKELLKADPEARLCNQSAVNTILAAFQVGLYVDKRCVGLGWGETIDIAIEMAARDGLKRLFGTTDSMPPIRLEKSKDLLTLEQRRTQIHN